LDANETDIVTGLPLERKWGMSWVVGGFESCLEFGRIGGIIRGESSEGVMMKTKALVEGILAGAVSAIFCCWALISPATLAAIAIRHKMPDAWFSGGITWYAMFAVIGVSMAVAGVACRLIYKHASTPRA
jgi:hypothetical protein